MQHTMQTSEVWISRELEDIDEVSIGHAIIARAVFVGLKEAVREMIELLRREK